MGQTVHFLRPGNRGEERPGLAVGRNRLAEGRSDRFNHHDSRGIQRAGPLLGRGNRSNRSPRRGVDVGLGGGIRFEHSVE